MSNSEADDLDLSFEEVLDSRINSLERFAIEQISDVKKTHKDLQESLNKTTISSDMASVKAELRALRTRIADQDQQIQELKKKLEEKASSAPTHTEVQETSAASSPEWTPERKKIRSEDFDQILKPFWPERSDARERLSERQQAFFIYMMDNLKIKDRRNLMFNANIVYNEGVSRGVWEEDWAPEGIKSSFKKYLEEKIKNYVKKLMKRTAEQSSED